MARLVRLGLVPSLDDVVHHHTSLSESDLERLHALVSDWQMLADLSFADLVLWLPDQSGLGFWAGAQIRPTTGPTAHVDDLVGSFVPQGRQTLLERAFNEGRICRDGDPEWQETVPVRVESIPVRRASEVLGVIGRNTNLLTVRTPSRLELTYLQTATDLAHMISEGRFPLAGERVHLGVAPRVGDGLIRLDAHGVVTYASPNGQSAFRRLGLTGDLIGSHLGAITAELIPPAQDAVEESLVSIVSGHAPREAEVESAGTSVIMRVIPLQPGGSHIAALVLLRDVTDLRRRERELLTKEATIREIHHRVKNNLQTVAALLRLQARRLDGPEGRLALQEAVRRVGTVAIVHEMLSQGFEERVDFDDVVDRILAMVGEVSVPEVRIQPRRAGTFGTVDAARATSLAMALTEVVQNAVQHGVGERGGTVTVNVDHGQGRVRASVDDDGHGLPVPFEVDDTKSLGLQIVRTLIENELDGRFQIGPRPDGGTRVLFDLPEQELRPRSG